LIPRSVNRVTYQQIIQDLRDLSIAHEQINSFGFGDLTQLTMDTQTKQSPVYTKLYIIPNDTVLDRMQLTYNFQVIVADRLKDDYSNQRDVMNDTLEIIKDVFTFLYLSEYESEWDATVEPFLERFEDVLAGWTMNLTITQPFDYNRCNVPERPFVNKKWYELAELWNTISTDWKNV
jgi:hypothetical protein